MGLNSNIEFCDHTAGSYSGCTHANLGCDNCWAEAFKAIRYGNDIWGDDKPRLEHLYWRQTLLKIQKIYEKTGVKQRVFFNDMTDMFEKSKPLIRGKGETIEIMPYKTHDLLNELLNDYVPKCTGIIFQFFTKRTPNIMKFIPSTWKTDPPKNVYIGASVVNQTTAKSLIPHLLKYPGNKFLSCEPLLDDTNLTPWLPELDWIIVGGESGHKRRPFNPDWARRIRDDCKEAGVAFFMKQMDKILPIPDDLKIREFHDDGPPFDWNENSKTPTPPMQSETGQSPIGIKSLLNWPSNVLHPLFK